MFMGHENRGECSLAVKVRDIGYENLGIGFG